MKQSSVKKGTDREGSCDRGNILGTVSCVCPRRRHFLRAESRADLLYAGWQRTPVRACVSAHDGYFIWAAAGYETIFP